MMMMMMIKLSSVLWNREKKTFGWFVVFLHQVLQIIKSQENICFNLKCSVVFLYQKNICFFLKSKQNVNITEYSSAYLYM